MNATEMVATRNPEPRAVPEPVVIPAGPEPGVIPIQRRSWFWSLYTWSHVLFLLFWGAVSAVVIGGIARLLWDRYAIIAQSLIAWAYRCVVRYHPRYRLTMTGLENLPPGAAVLCPNHQSLSDVVYLFSIPVGVKWVIKRELYRVPLFGAAMRIAGYLAVDRGDSASAMAVVNRALEYLGAGIKVLSFPEGTRSNDGTLGRFQSGPARLAIAAQVPLVPVGVVGTANLLPRGSFGYPAETHICIHVGSPIATAGRTQHDARALTRELRAAVMAAKAEAAAVHEAGAPATTVRVLPARSA